MPAPPRALLSVHDKTGLSQFARALVEMGWELLSTGGTAKLLREHGLSVIDVSEVTGHPEMFDGRVKTLHPAIHSPLLARLEQGGDATELEAAGYQPIQLVAVNLYPFSKAAARRPPLGDSGLLEMVDIGGPTLLRAAAKNHANVLAVCDPQRYDSVLAALTDAGGDADGIDPDLRRELALEAFEHTSGYDVAITAELHGRWVGRAEYADGIEQAKSLLPARLLIDAEKRAVMRYGENPHQAAAFYADSRTTPPGLGDIAMHGGKPLSYNNYVDLDSALRLARGLSSDDWPTTPHACILVKHNNPCGAALAATQEQAWLDALASDTESAYGCIIAFNTTVRRETAEAIGTHFVECVIAPGYEPAALELLCVKKNRRILSLPGCADRLAAQTPSLVARQVVGGWMLQTERVPRIDPATARSVTEIEPCEKELASMRFGMVVCEQVKSNSVIFVKGTRTVGIGPGQTSRVEAVRIAARRAGEQAQGAVMVSDAFFPFRDGIDAAHEMGITSIVQPGGSIRDSEIIDAADEHGMSMLFTGVRLFRH